MIKSVAKALEILNIFTPNEPRMTLSEIARRMGIPKSTVHNLLSTLLAYGYIEKLEDDHYALGNFIITLTQAVRINVELRDRAAPLLRELANACRDSVYLTVLDGDYCLYVYAIESPSRLLARTVTGDRVPLHCTATGKAILASLPDKQVSGILTRVGMPSFTSATITDPEKLYKDLTETRKRGFALDTGEHEKNVYCIGAPIFNHQGRGFAACSISGVDPEIIKGRRLELSALVTNTAQEISRRMGYVPANLSSLTSIPEA